MATLTLLLISIILKPLVPIKKPIIYTAKTKLVVLTTEWLP